jgi:hypothetical protein
MGIDFWWLDTQWGVDFRHLKYVKDFSHTQSVLNEMLRNADVVSESSHIMSRSIRDFCQWFTTVFNRSLLTQS